MDALARRIPNQITRNQFAEIGDILVNTLYPVDREVQFLETSEARKKLMQCEHIGKHRFENFWLEFSKLSIKYVQLHSAAEANVTVRELIALHVCTISKYRDLSFSPYFKELCTGKSYKILKWKIHIWLLEMFCDRSSPN